MADLPTKVLSDQEVPLFTRAGRLATTRRVSIMVGDFGPFYKEFPEGQDSNVQVRIWMNEKQRDVQALQG